MKRFLFSPIGIASALAAPALLFSWYISSIEVDVKLVDSDPVSRRDRTQVIGGVERPLSDITPARASRLKATVSKDNQHVEYEFGRIVCPKVPLLSKGQNSQMDSVIEAVETGKYPERLSPFHTPAPFDVDAWKANNEVYRWKREGESFSSSTNNSNVRLVAFQEEVADEPIYLDVAEPGRIYDVAQPASDVPVLTNASASYFEMADGEAVRIGVKTRPLAPVSFTAFGVGKFENGLTTITNVADEQGIATAVYVTATGAETTEVVTGSPVASGTVRFTLRRTFIASPPSTDTQESSEVTPLVP